MTTETQPTVAQPLHGVDVSSKDSADAVLRRVKGIMQRTLEQSSWHVLQTIASTHLNNHGRCVRAQIALRAAHLLEVPVADSVHFSAACELVHNASLVHDDIQDGDRVRRGQPTLWVQYGVQQAITAGDLMLMLPTLALDSAPYSDELKWKLSRCIARRSAATACGQALEHTLSEASFATRTEYEQAAMGKTGQFFAMPVEGAVILAGHPDVAEAIGDVAMDLGILFQLKDDLIDFYGNKKKRLPGSDLREGKINALFVCHFELAPKDITVLQEVLQNRDASLSEQTVGEWGTRLIESGAFDRVIEWGSQLIERMESNAHLSTMPKLRDYLLQTSKVMLNDAAALRPDNTDSPHEPLATEYINEPAT